MIWRGLKECYRSLREEVGSRYGVELEGTKAIGISRDDAWLSGI